MSSENVFKFILSCGTNKWNVMKKYTSIYPKHNRVINVLALVQEEAEVNELQ